eukprot:scaffold7.g3428.t1
MPLKAATIDPIAVKAAGGGVLEDGSGISIGGWTVRSGKGPITTDAECEQLKDRLGILAMPEQFYGSNFLELRHEASGAVLRFTAMGALRGWLGDRSERVHVDASRDWLRSRAHEVAAHQAKTLEYDWTFTTSYLGDLELPSITTGGCSSPHAGGASSSGGGGSSSGSAAAGGAAGARPPPAAAAAGDDPAAPPSATEHPAAAAAPAEQPPAAGAQWHECETQINRGLLMSRDPILLFDEITLYESELEDNGVSQVGLKVRVMPRCWFVLLHFFLRVDRVCVRLREARLFCQVKHHEGSFAALRAAGALAEGPAYADAGAAGAALMAAAPVGVAAFRTERLVLPGG